MSGMKAGSADDPFADDKDDGSSASEPASESAEAPTNEAGAAQSRKEDHGGGNEPYVDRRDGAKDERRLVQFFLRDEVYGEMAEGRLRSTVGEELGEMPGKFDLREALVAVGQEHEDEVVERLRKMGL